MNLQKDCGSLLHQRSGQTDLSGSDGFRLSPAPTNLSATYKSSAAKRRVLARLELALALAGYSNAETLAHQTFGEVVL